jgi:hypothetical protein
VAPLTALLKNNSFTWTPATDQAFQALKTTMCTTSVLALPDFTKTFVLECDASEEELEQSLCKREDLWPLPTNNCQNTIWANQSMKRKCWLFCMQWISGALISWGNASKLRQIIKASSIFWSNDLPPEEQQKWVTKLFGYDYEIIYKKGKENVVVDTLSQKYEDEGSLFSLSFIVPDWLQVVCQEWLQDPKISHVIQQLQANSPVSPGYSWHNDELHYKVHLYLSKQSQLKSTVLSELHATPTTGHLGFTKTYDQVKHYFFGMV